MQEGQKASLTHNRMNKESAATIFESGYRIFPKLILVLRKIRRNQRSTQQSPMERLTKYQYVHCKLKQGNSCFLYACVCEWMDNWAKGIMVLLLQPNTFYLCRYFRGYSMLNSMKNEDISRGRLGKCRCLCPRI